ncbi:MAG: hypothetical protein ABFC38_02175 [Methanospirillum sp.]
MYVDSNGVEIRQVKVWLPAAVHALVRADRLNLSQFIRDQLDVLYGEESAVETVDKNLRLIQAARDGLARQKAVDDESLEARERLRAVARQLRKERKAEREQRQTAKDEAATREAGIRDALDAIVGEGSLARYRRALPENDPSGDRIDDLDDLVARVSRRAGIAVEPAEVAAEVRRRAERADAGEGP